MRSSILHLLFAGRRISRSAKFGRGGGMLMSTMAGAASPWLMLPPGCGSSGDMIYNFYRLAKDRQLSLGSRLAYEGSRIVGSSHGWLALFNKRDNHLFLTNPISRRRINLPPTDAEVSRVALSCSPDAEDYECRAMMSFGLKDGLAFCLPGRSTGWTPIGMEADSYEDFVYSHKIECLFCMTNWKLEVECWDLSNPECPRIGRKDPIKYLPREEREYPPGGKTEQRYLVYSEQLDQLYLIRRYMMERVGPDGKFVKDIYYGNLRAWDNSYPYKTVDFDVHLIDSEKELEEEVSLDGMAIFIGINHGLVVDADEFGVNANSIYFTDNTRHTPPDERDRVNRDWRNFVYSDYYGGPKWVDTVYGGHDIGIFDYKKKTFSPCFYPSDVQSLKRIDPPPLWFTPTRCLTSDEGEKTRMF